MDEINFLNRASWESNVPSHPNLSKKDHRLPKRKHKNRSLPRDENLRPIPPFSFVLPFFNLNSKESLNQEKDTLPADKTSNPENVPKSATFPLTHVQGLWSGQISLFSLSIRRLILSSFWKKSSFDKFSFSVGQIFYFRPNIL